MTTIYLIRHAEAEGNVYRRIQGQHDSLVTPRGFAQIKALEKRFEHVKIDAVYSSDLTRARMTAAALYMPRRLRLITMRELREVDIGCWEDTPFGELARSQPKMLDYFTTDPARWRIEGCESFEAVQERLFAAVKGIAEENGGRTVAVVSHGFAIRAFLCRVTGTESCGIAQIEHSDNTGVTLLTYDGGAFTAEYMNDASHLDRGLSTFQRQKWWKKGERPSGGDRNIWFRPMDLEAEGERYVGCRRDAWIVVHGDMRGFSADSLALARRAAAEDPRAVVEAMLGDEPCGVLELNLHRDEDKGAGCIAFYYIYPSFRKQGLGVQLLGHAVTVYRSKGRRLLRLRVAEENRTAMRFYLSCGFEKTGQEQGAVGALWVMDKDIALPE